MANTKLENCVPPQEPRYPAFPTVPIFETLRDNARKYHDKTAINFYGYKISYSELDNASDKFASVLVQAGLSKSDRVAIMLENCPQFVISFYGILKMGGVVVTCNPMYKVEELRHELHDAGVKAIIIEDQLYHLLAACRDDFPDMLVFSTCFTDYLPDQPEIAVHPSMTLPRKEVPNSQDFKEAIDKATPLSVSPSMDMQNDLALLQYTAGTTGVAKGAMLTHYNLACHNAFIKHFYQFTADDVHCVILPLFHISGLDIALNPPLGAGGTLILFSRFEPVPVLESIQKYKVTVWVTISTINVAYLNLPVIKNYDLSSLRLNVSGGAPVPIDFHPRWESMVGCHISEGYGLSESCGGIIGDSHFNYKPGSVGSPLYYHEIKIMDIDQTPPVEITEANKEGELWIKGPCVMKGYWNDPAKTAETIVDSQWLRTGDIAKIDEDGWIFITGRYKEMIKVSGHSVFLAEIDALLFGHPAVAEVATIGVPHPYRGEVPLAYIVPKKDYADSITEEEIINWCKERITSYKVPQTVKFVSELPKSGSGKILRRVLAEEYKKSQP